MMEQGDIYYNDDHGFHILVTELGKPYYGWCTVYVLELAQKNWYPIYDISKQLYGWRKLT